MSLQALIFDFDGTLVDSMGRFFPSWNMAGAKFGISVTEAAFYSYAGLPLPEIVRILHREQLGGEADAAFVAAFLEAKCKAHEEYEQQVGPPPVIESVKRLATQAEESGVPIAIATSGLWQHVEGHIKHNRLEGLFSRSRGNVVCAAEVQRGKPEPDIYLEAARRVGADPRFCRAYEDGESGLISAYRAGCHVIDVTYMDEYPLVEGLRIAKKKAQAERDWLDDK